MGGRLSCGRKPEQEKKDRKRIEEIGYPFVIVKVSNETDLYDQIGRDICFDLVDLGKVRTYYAWEGVSLKSLKREEATRLEILTKYLWSWTWETRKNSTYRPARQLTLEEEKQSIGQLSETFGTKGSRLNLFMEIGLGQHRRPLSPPNDILIFFKLYNPEKKELRYIGRLYVKKHGTPDAILPELYKMAEFNPNVEVELYKEVKFEPEVECILIKKEKTFETSKFGDGDIICIQKAPVGIVEPNSYPTFPSFMKHMLKPQEKKPEKCEKVRFSWTINNFNSLTSKHNCGTITTGGNKWGVLIYPKGDEWYENHFSIYLDVVDSAALPRNWYSPVTVTFRVVDQHDRDLSIERTAQHMFVWPETTWGFERFMPLMDLYDPARGYIVDDTVIVEMDIAVY